MSVTQADCELLSMSVTKANIHHIIYNGVCTPCEAYTYGKMIMSGKAVVKKNNFKANYNKNVLLFFLQLFSL